MTLNHKRLCAFFVLLSLLTLTSCVIRLPNAVPTTASVPPASPPASPSATDWHSGVKTDYSGLTPYKPFEEHYTRLSDNPMPDLIPSKQYGKLLPYVGEMMYAEWGYSIRQFGLATMTGKLVTDAVYTNVYQGSYYNYGSYTGETVPVYSLERLSDKIDKNNPWDSVVHAACAQDGSWVTPFEYKTIFFTDKVMMLVRNNDKNDIDIMDYSGTLLYNTKTLGCYDDIPPASGYTFMSGYGEGVITVPLTGNRSVFIDVLTGKETVADYEQCSAFSEGLAAVKQNSLYGYVDKSLRLVIPPQYMSADVFSNGKGIIQYPDNSYAIIDESGKVLLKSANYISRWDASTYGLYDSNNNTQYYDSALKEITYDEKPVTPLYNGWFFVTGDNMVTVFKGEESHTFKDVNGVYSIDSGLAVLYKNGTSVFQEGIATLDGKMVIPFADNQSLSIIHSEKTDKTFVIASVYGNLQSYRVYTTDGTLLFSGHGYAIYNPQNDLFEVNDDISFGYVDTSGNYIFRISLMRYLPD